MMRTRTGLTVLIALLFAGLFLALDGLFALDFVETIFPMVSSANMDAVTSLVRVATVLISIAV